jgi:2-polyprenyl-6-hydroxyphenyl methylase/3-demethylubiquinone-9 3-methyltransferase
VELSVEDRAIEVLDFGCGTGVLSKDVADLGARVTAVDSSEAMIGAAQLHLRNMQGRVDLEWISNDCGIGAYQGRVYDVVLCISVLEFVEELRLILSRLCSCVAQGGILILSVPNRHSWLRRIEKLAYRHTAMTRRFSRLEYLAQPECYLSIQKHQLTLKELSSVVQQDGMWEEEHRFCVAPRVLGRLEGVERVGMTLVAVFRKPTRDADAL